MPAVSISKKGFIMRLTVIINSWLEQCVWELLCLHLLRIQMLLNLCFSCFFTFVVVVVVCKCTIFLYFGVNRSVVFSCNLLVLQSTRWSLDEGSNRWRFWRDKTSWSPSLARKTKSVSTTSPGSKRRSSSLMQYVWLTDFMADEEKSFALCHCLLDE